ncbi:hypothetical protein YYG_00687 [Plasmodium vinckei petteri]|uniref:PIR protein CIR protein n=1 Tax=Plasmodium vinckei petteri TaxID=138298 RepID=W7AYC0_PLAVN|nr:hypothetical protein YYG_00687 [Plasmodium vinckei petteri]
MARGNIYQNINKSIHRYCHYGNTSGKCNGYFQMASSGVIHLLKTLRDNHHLEYDKLAEYAILWLSYKLNAKLKDKLTDLNEFYAKYIVNNNSYNDKINGDDNMTYKKIIDTNKDLLDIKELSKFNFPFHILFYLNYVYHDERLFCDKYSGYAKTFVSKFEELNKSSKNIEGSSYTKLLSTLSDDYKNLKKKYHDNNKCTNFPSLPELTPQKSRSNKKNDIESQRENQSNNTNNNSNNHEYEKTRYRHTTCCGLFVEYKYPDT